MNPHSNNREPRDEDSGNQPGPVKETAGQRAHGGDQAGPASDQAGRPLAPQTGEPIDHAH